MAQFRLAESAGPGSFDQLVLDNQNGPALFLTTLAHSHPVQSLLSSGFSADESFVGPDVEPVSVAAAIGNPHIVEIGMNSRQCLGAFKIEDYLRVTADMDVGVQDLVIVAQHTAALEIGDNRRDAILRGAFQWPVFLREIDLSLDAAASRRRSVRREHMRKAEPGEAYIAVVKIGPLSFGEVGAIDPEIDHDATCASQFLGCLNHIWGRARDHRNQLRQGHRRNYRVIPRNNSVSEVKFFRRWV